MGGVRVEERTDLVERLDHLLIATPADESGARRRRVEAEDDPHGGGLAGTVRTEEAGHVPGAHREAETVHGGDRAVALGEVRDLDHEAGRRCEPEGAVSHCATSATTAGSMCWAGSYSAGDDGPEPGKNRWLSEG